MTTKREMPRYRSHKTIQALKIKTVQGESLTFEDGYPAMDLEPKVFVRYTPKPGDYLVVYEDGYKSISPAKAFEEGYTRI